MRIIVTAGGTGGHIYPALAIINKLKELHNDLSILYIGTTDRMEATLVPSLGIAYKGIKMKGLDRSHLLENIHVYKYYKDAIKEAEKTILDFKPDVVVGVGGYITLPVIIAASKHNIKTFIHEQNSIPGLSNKILKKKATCIGVSLEDSLKYFKGANAHFTGKENGDVYADYKYGDEFTIKMISLEKSEYISLNELERHTIMTYNAFSKGYNKTRGNKF